LQFLILPFGELDGVAPIRSYSIFRQISAASRPKSHLLSGMANYKSRLVLAKVIDAGGWRHGSVDPLCFCPHRGVPFLSSREALLARSPAS
jgi:hypothetical protein